MKITNILQKLQDKDHYSVFVDGKYAFSLSGAALLKSQLVRGQELSNDQFKEWKRIAAEDKLYVLALSYATLRPHSQSEIEQYLKRKQASPTLTSNILNKLSKIGLINDESFSRSWINNRRLLRPTSKRKLQQELRAKNVDDEIITRVLTEEEFDELQGLRDLVNKKMNLPKYKNDQLKLMQYLARQGYDYGDIKTVLNEKD